MWLIDKIKAWVVARWLKKPPEIVPPRLPRRVPKTFDPPQFVDKYQKRFDDDPELAAFDRNVKQIVSNIKAGIPFDDL